LCDLENEFITLVIFNKSNLCDLENELIIVIIFYKSNWDI